MKNILIKEATIINEGRSFTGSVVINDDKIAKIIEGTDIPDEKYDEIIDARGKYLIPGVIDDHGRAADGWTNVHPAVLTGFAFVDEVVVLVTDHADRGAAVVEELADFARGQTDDDVVAFGAEDLSRGSGRAAHLAAFPRLELDVVDEGSFGDVLELAAIAGFDVGRFARDDDVAHLEALRLDDVALLAVGIEDEGDVGVAVGIVLDGLDDAFDPVLIATEVDEAVTVLVPPADMPAGDHSLVIAAARMFLRGQQRFFRSGCSYFAERRVRHSATALRVGAVCSDSHFLFSYIGCFLVELAVIPYSLKRSIAEPS